MFTFLIYSLTIHFEKVMSTTDLICTIDNLHYKYYYKKSIIMKIFLFFTFKYFTNNLLVLLCQNHFFIIRQSLF